MGAVFHPINRFAIEADDFGELILGEAAGFPALIDGCAQVVSPLHDVVVGHAPTVSGFGS